MVGLIAGSFFCIKNVFSGIDNTKIVLIFITHTYRKKVKNRLEFSPLGTGQNILGTRQGGEDRGEKTFFEKGSKYLFPYFNIPGQQYIERER